jgi:ribosomal protein S3
MRSGRRTHSVASSNRADESAAVRDSISCAVPARVTVRRAVRSYLSAAVVRKAWGVRVEASASAVFTTT